MDVFKALADPSRRDILRLLRDGPRTSGEIAVHFPTAWATISRHLAVLRDAGVVDVRADGRRRIYRLRPESLEPVSEWLLHRQRVWQQRMDALHTEVARGARQRRDEG